MSNSSDPAWQVTPATPEAPPPVRAYVMNGSQPLEGIWSRLIWCIILGVTIGCSIGSCVGVRFGMSSYFRSVGNDNTNESYKYGP